jgi:hypothetical protein
VSPIELQIKVDEAAFADPGSEVAGMTSTNGANSAGAAASAYSQPNSAKAVTGNRE